ncbi:MAG: sigma factor-like helix-turn-helix DNA-binding protein [Halobacteriales archaeon]|nr:sigma factor-like helix-turn-helix DNA-binding protein [Halobacteriales archaeon]
MTTHGSRPVAAGECYVELLTDLTGLGTNPAEVLTMELAGYSHEQIAAALGHSVTQIEKYAKRARDHREAVRGSEGALEPLFQYL